MSCGQGAFVVSMVLLWVWCMCRLAARKPPTLVTARDRVNAAAHLAKVVFQFSPANDNRERNAFALPLLLATVQGPNLCEIVCLVVGLSIAWVVFDLLTGDETKDKRL